MDPKNSRWCQDSNPGLQVEKRERYLCATKPPLLDPNVVGGRHCPGELAAEVQREGLLLQRVAVSHVRRLAQRTSRPPEVRGPVPGVRGHPRGQTHQGNITIPTTAFVYKAISVTVGM